MSAVNLGILSTFWSKIKSFFSANTYDAVVLYNGAASTDVYLSEAIDNFERIEVTMEYDNDIKVISDFVPSLTSTFFSTWSHWANIGSNSYLKIATFGIDNDRNNIFIYRAVNIKLTYASSSTITRSAVSNYSGISKVVGINRVASN